MLSRTKTRNIPPSIRSSVSQDSITTNYGSSTPREGQGSIRSSVSQDPIINGSSTPREGQGLRRSSVSQDSITTNYGSSTPREGQGSIRSSVSRASITTTDSPSRGNLTPEDAQGSSVSQTGPLQTGSYFPFPERRDRCPPGFIYDPLWDLIREVFLKSDSKFYINGLVDTERNPPHLIQDSKNSPYIIVHPWIVPQDSERNVGQLGLYLENDLLDILNTIDNWSLMLPIVKTTKIEGLYQKTIISVRNIGKTQYVLLIIEKRGRVINSYILDPKGTDTSKEDTRFIENSVKAIFINSQITQKTCHIQSDIDPINSKYFVVRMMYNYIKEGVDLQQNNTLNNICPGRSFKSSSSPSAQTFYIDRYGNEIYYLSEEDKRYMERVVNPPSRPF